MRTFIVIFIVSFTFFINDCSNKAVEGVIPLELSCEYRINPLGVEAGKPGLSWTLKSEKRNQKQAAYRILVASSEAHLKADRGDLWDSGRVDSEQSVQIVYQGKKLNSRMHCYWKVHVWDKNGIISDWSKPAFWEMGLLESKDWKAKWIGYDCPSAPMLRKEFTVNKSIREARVYICGLGYYELSINGFKIGDHVLDPGQTDYEQRVFYVVYDVTKNLKQGNNAIGVILGDGWFNESAVNKTKYGWDDMVYGKPRLIFQMHVIHTDGTETLVVSDEIWKGSSGPIISNNVYAGEYYDAGLEQHGWDTPGFDDSNWGHVLVVEEPGGKLVSQKLPPIKRMQTVKPVKLTNPKPGVYVYDMGQNFAGWAKLRVKAERGTTIQLRFTESIHKDGMIDPASTGVFATHVVQTDRYACKGSGLEVWEPRFTYHGFRYVEMTGFPSKPSLDNLEGVVIYTGVEEAGHFECSDEMLNRIHQTALWTQISNMHSVPTDCPARERCGWLGDAHVSAEMTIYNLDVPLFWLKYIRDIETSRRGGIPNDIAPGRRTGGENPHPDWGTAFVQLPWYIYLYYADISVIREHYEGMNVFLNHLKSIAKNYIVYEGYGDWCPPRGVYPIETPVELTSTAYFYFDAKIMSRMAQILGREHDAESYNQLAQNIKSSFNEKFYDVGNKTYGSQTGDSFALYLGLVPKGDESAVAESLARNVIEKHGGHHATGITGSRHLYWALGRYGHGNVAQSIFHNTTYPSIGYLFSLGATTLWECWGEPEIDEKHNPRSRNHPMQGGFDAWFYQGIAGINPDPENPGFKHIILRPQLIGNLTFARARYQSIHGLIASEWQIHEDTLEWFVSIPANTTATVYIPTERAEAVSESGKLAAYADGVEFLRMENGNTVFSVGSGEYTFIIKGGG